MAYGDRRENGSTINLQTRLAIHEIQNREAKKDITKIAVTTAVVIGLSSIPQNTVLAAPLGNELSVNPVVDVLTKAIDFVDSNNLLPVVAVVDGFVDTVASVPQYNEQIRAANHNDKEKAKREGQDPSEVGNRSSLGLKQIVSITKDQSIQETFTLAASYVLLHGYRALAGNISGVLGAINFALLSVPGALLSLYAVLPDVIAKPLLSWVIDKAIPTVAQEAISALSTGHSKIARM